jgi:hypothetical protein
MNKILSLALAALAFSMLLTAAPAHAQECEPKTWKNPNAPGSQRVEEWAIDGRVDAWWCPVPAPSGAPAGSTWFRRNDVGGLYVLGWQAVQAAAPRVLAASSPWDQFQAERAAILAAVTPTAAQTCRRDEIKHAACVSLYLARLPGYPGASTRAEALDSTRCGPVPDCAAVPPPTIVWRTPAAGTLTLYTVTAGARGTAIFGRKAPASALCDCAALKLTTTVAGIVATYCPVAAASAAEVTLCRQAPQ